MGKWTKLGISMTALAIVLLLGLCYTIHWGFGLFMTVVVLGAGGIASLVHADNKGEIQ